MEDQTTNNQPSPAIHNKPSARAAGVISLVLVFFAGASFTWVFLSESKAPTPVAVAAAAQALPPEEDVPVQPAFDSVRLQAKAAVVVDLTEGKTLYTLNADTPLPLASLTKVALTLVVADALPKDSIITIPYDTSPYDTPQKLRAGDQWKLQDVIDFTLAVSSNEGADILAHAADEPIRARYFSAPAENAAVWRMNQLASQIGLTHTYFLNATGLDESETQAGAYGSAQDVATLFAYAADTALPTFSATTKSFFKLQSLNGAETTAINTDEALPVLPGVLLGKTGFTDLAGGNLALVFEIKGHRISAAVLGSTASGRFEDMKALVAATTRTLEEGE